MKRFKLLPQPSPDSVDSLLLPVSGFPVPSHELDPLRRFVLALYDYHHSSLRLESEIFVQVEHLHRLDNAHLFAVNAARWLPVLGLGIWPDREPPRSWTREELEELQEGQAPRTLMPQLFQITSNGDSHRQTLEAMLGTGTLICAFTSPPAAKMTTAARDLFLPQIRDPEFRVFRCYFPLIDSATLASAAQQPDDAEGWFCEARVYLRESVEDSGILIASRGSLAPALEALGCHRDDHEPDYWKIEA